MKEDLFDGLIKSMEKEFGHTTEYATYEERLKRVILSKKANLSEEEEEELKRLKSLPLSPETKAFARKLKESL